jgi:phospholipase A1
LPSRETNYELELFWLTQVPWKILSDDVTVLALGIVHRSNGGSQLFSRSWNGVYANLIWERNRYVFSFKPRVQTLVRKKIRP